MHPYFKENRSNNCDATTFNVQRSFYLVLWNRIKCNIDSYILNELLINFQIYCGSINSAQTHEVHEIIKFRWTSHLPCATRGASKMCKCSELYGNVWSYIQFYGSVSIDNHKKLQWMCLHRSKSFYRSNTMTFCLFSCVSWRKMRCNCFAYWVCIQMCHLVDFIGKLKLLFSCMIETIEYILHWWKPSDIPCWWWCLI